MWPLLALGPTGLAAAFELQQSGHACTLFDGAPEPGGRLRSQPTEEELPRDVLDAEIEQILRLGVVLKTGTPICDQETFNAVAEQFDAVLVACGTLNADEIGRFGLKSAGRGISIDRETYATDSPGVFAAGNAVRGNALPIRSVADGKEAAQSINHFLRNEPIQPHRRPFSSRIGQVSSDEMSEFLAGASPIGRAVPNSDDDLQSALPLNKPIGASPAVALPTINASSNIMQSSTVRIPIATLASVRNTKSSDATDRFGLNLASASSANCA